MMLVMNSKNNGKGRKDIIFLLHGTYSLVEKETSIK